MRTMGSHGELAWAYFGVFVGSVIESTVLPWPVELPLTALMLRGRVHVFPAAGAVWAGSVLGCTLAFIAGGVAFDGILALMAGRFSWLDGMATAQDNVGNRAGWAVFWAMFTPTPQLASFAGGAAGVSWGLFVLACGLGRGLRYAAMAVLVFIFGDRIMTWWRMQSGVVRWGVIAAAVAIFVMLLGITLFG